MSYNYNGPDEDDVPSIWFEDVVAIPADDDDAD